MPKGVRHNFLRVVLIKIGGLINKVTTRWLLWLYAPRLTHGRNFRLFSGARLYALSEDAFRIGDDVVIDSRVLMYSTIGEITIGDGTMVGPYAVVYGPVEIGKHALIAGHAVIVPWSHGFADLTLPMAQQSQSALPIKIEDDVWLGTHVVVTGGITIGRGSIIGSGSVVTKSIPPYSIAVGAPARVIGTRNADDKR